MKSFSFTHDQLVSIVAALTADELSRRYGRYTETLTLSRWGEETKLGRGGVDATPDQRESCARRVARFFDFDESLLKVEPSDTFGAWAKRIAVPIRDALLHFRFHPSTQSGDAETRHNADDIYQDAAAVASLMQGRRRAVALVSPHSLVGLVTSVLAPNLQRIDVTDGRAFSPDELSDYLKFGDIVIATPTLWRYLADTMPSFANNVMGLSFGERLSVDLAARLRQRGLGAMRELYGSTETGLLAWRESAPDPFVLFEHWSHKNGSIVRMRPNGRPASLIAMDDLAWHNARSFDLGRRLDGAVQIGAINVFPSSIANIITDHPGVAACEVRVSQRPGALDRLIAEIKLERGQAPDQAMAWSIDEWCRNRLRPAERPRIYSFYSQSD
ncbi:hypothetical protein [Parvularcula sp. LCG005]|uniref:hypothetical protein n=1 Tax=Parvularcula sp. LCG005 TaxID=3078805 RepID=UPI00294384A4|nr:hypothetical protein [Parvularcula sp. LCG005]WOI53557.1 hypothetical protein RUI03_00850 [Parvularcula sp. LCG005]